MLKTAMIFAAGRGERLQPLTNKIPKPMCLVKGIPLIEHLVRQLAQQGIEHIVINHAHLGDAIRHHLKTGHHLGVKISYSPEPPGALETAGGLIQALPLLGSAPFLTLSGDIFTDFPFGQLQLPSESLAHLILVPKQAHTASADFGLDENGRVCFENKAYTYGNIACIHPQIFKDKSIQRLGLARFLAPHIKQHAVTGDVYQGRWLDTGELTRLEQAQQM